MRSEMEGGAHRPNGGTAEEVPDNNGTETKHSARKKQGDAFTRRREEWRAQVQADPSCDTTHFECAYLLSTYFNREKFEREGVFDAWPRQETLATRARVSVRTIHRRIEHLEKCGHLKKTDGRGRGHSVSLVAILKAGPEQGRLFDRGETLSKRPDKVSSPPTSPAQDIYTAAFETWWKQYPKRVAKAQAHREYMRVIKSGRATTEDLFAGVLRYSSERTGQDPKYTKHPSTWLNAGCWNDEPSSSGAFAYARPVAARKKSILEIAMEGLEDGDPDYDND
jgi:hypothetical protein